MLRLLMTIVTLLVFNGASASAQDSDRAHPKTDQTISGGATARKSTGVRRAKQMTGKVLSVDTENRSLRVETRGRAVTVAWNNATNIRIGKETHLIVDLKTGQLVRIRYDDHGDKKTASVISVID